MSSPLRSKKRGNVIVWILMGMLILGLGGFGARNFGGSMRSIGTVGDQDIDLNDYARTLQREISAVSAQIGQPVSFAQAQSLGIDRSVLATVVATAALDNEANVIGVSVGDDEVRKRILEIPAFSGIDGSFDRDAYALALRQEGLSEAEFEAKLRDEAARTIVQDAVTGATAAPQGLVDDLASWLTETRSFTLADLRASSLEEPVPTPSEEEIAAYYEANPATFTRPETRRISYIWLSPESVAQEVQLDDAALRASYEERIDEFVTPEQRLVERLVYPDEESARAAKARLDAGEITFEGLAAERGLTLADADLGEVSEADLGAAGPDVFALDGPGVVGPLPSNLGPALYSMNAILEAREVSFEEARQDLSSEAAHDRARRLISERSEGIEDILAGGASLEEVAEETGMELGQIEVDADTAEGIAAYPAFRDTAMSVTENDFPTIAALDDGGIFALRLDGIDPPALRPIEEVRQQVADLWIAAETRKRLQARAEELAADVSGGDDLAAGGLVTTRYKEFARDGFINGAPAGTAERVFDLAVGETDVIPGEDAAFIVVLDEIHQADPSSPEMEAARQGLSAQIAQTMAQDMFQLYTQTVQAKAGINIDQAAVNAVNAQLN